MIVILLYPSQCVLPRNKGSWTSVKMEPILRVNMIRNNGSLTTVQMGPLVGLNVIVSTLNMFQDGYSRYNNFVETSILVQ